MAVVVREDGRKRAQKRRRRGSQVSRAGPGWGMRWVGEQGVPRVMVAGYQAARTLGPKLPRPTKGAEI